MLQQSVNFNDTDITDIFYPVEKRLPQADDPFHLDLSRNKLLSNPATYNDSEDEHLQVRTIHELHPTLMKQSLNDSFFDPSFFKNTSKLKTFFYLMILH